MNSAAAKYDGVKSILRYNAPYYVQSACILVALGATLALIRTPSAFRLTLFVTAGLTAFWTLISLVASYYVYDYIGVTRWNWIPAAISFPPRRWVNIHAGLDDSTQKLAAFFPDSEHIVLDVYDPLEMTERSIARARQERRFAEPPNQARLDALPLTDDSCDAVFLLFSAHEIRNPKRRLDFFVELARILAPPGELLLVEHLRDWKNFVAFGPGCLHFFSRSDWLRVATQAGLVITQENSITPLVRCFFMQKRAA